MTCLNRIYDELCDRTEIVGLGGTRNGWEDAAHLSRENEVAIFASEICKYFSLYGGAGKLEARLADMRGEAVFGEDEIPRKMLMKK